MPIYEYRCQKCGHYLDVLQKVSDDPLKRCPACETEALKRLISAPAFRLKGGGWYETDFKSEKEKRRNLAESSDGAGNGKADSSSGGEAQSSTESKSGESKPSERGSKSGESKPSGSGSKSGDDSAKSGASTSGDGSQSKAAV